MKNELTYKEAFEELQQIVGEMERGNIDVDELLEKVGRASELIKICKEKLFSTEDNVKKVLATLEKPEEGITFEEDEDDEDENNPEGADGMVTNN